MVVQTKSEATDEYGNSCWRGEESWEVADGVKRVSARSVPSFSLTAALDRPSLPPAGSLFTRRWLDSILGRVSESQDAGGVKSYRYERLLWVREVDALGHVKAAELVPSANQRRSHRYLGEYPAETLYATTTVTDTYEATRISDPLGNLIEVEKDWLGRKTAYRDPDMG